MGTFLVDGRKKTDFDKTAVSGILKYSNKSYVPILFTYNVDITT